ncbi:MAG: hypothetical protein QOH17_2670, partial [Pseudonocardiales bacterium]|nr:hypothetical protein [Pseudonocardiales bacterium]
AVVSTTVASGLGSAEAAIATAVAEVASDAVAPRAGMRCARSTLVGQSAREGGLAGSGKATDERQQRYPTAASASGSAPVWSWGKHPTLARRRAPSSPVIPHLVVEVEAVEHARAVGEAATTVAPQDQSPRRPPNPEQVDPSSRTGTAQTSA